MSNKLNPEIHGFTAGRLWLSSFSAAVELREGGIGFRGRIYAQWRGTVWEMNFRQVKTRAWRKN